MKVGVKGDRATWQIAAAISVAVLLIVEIARLSVAHAVAANDPTLAAKLAPQSPASLTAASMAQVGEAAAQGANLGEPTLERLRALAHLAPFQVEPFLVEAAVAERDGDYGRATQLLNHAKARDPRSIAAHFLSADVATRRGDVLEALREIAVLTRLVPGTGVKLVPGLAEFVKLPGSREKLATVLAENPQLKNPLLTALAEDPDNADLIVALAGKRTGPYDSDTRTWQGRLLLGLTNRGQYGRAYALWRYFSEIPQSQRPLLFNGSFREVAAAPPFNWSLSTSPAGVTETGPHKLRVLYYGREDALLASQLLVLPPGRYRFTYVLTGSPVKNALSWNLACAGSNAAIMNLNLNGGGGGGTFTVPGSACPAQQLQLNGHAQESPQDTDVRIGPVDIERMGQ